MALHQSLPWHDQLYNWYPFKIDALGLVTLLGAEEINASLGRLVPSRWLEYFPLLGAYVIAGERFKDKLPAFNFYNISDGIHTTELSFWLTRWMLEQDFEITRSIVQFEVASQPRSWLKWHLVAGSLSALFTGFLIVLTILIGDWYGLANAVAMIVAVITRAYTMQVHRDAIDRAVESAGRNLNGRSPNDNMKTAIVIPSDVKVVTMLLPGHLLVPVFSHNPEPAHPSFYHFVRFIGWGFFGVHIITIGMAQLVPQMYTVALIVIPTVLICWKLGCDDSKWGSTFERKILRRHPDKYYECWIGTRIKAKVFEWPEDYDFEFHEGEIDPATSRKGRWTLCRKDDPADRSKRRQDLYAWLNMTDEEEQSLGKWDLFPHERNGNKVWWDTYLAKKALIRHRPVEMARRKTECSQGDGTGTFNLTAVGNDDKNRYFYNGASEITYAPRRSNLTLTPNGLVAPVRSVANALFAAGMQAAGPNTPPSLTPDLEGIPVMRPSYRKQRSDK